jgi:CRISPR/Cas system-associated exonuclease Cas4 (RecB family)
MQDEKAITIRASSMRLAVLCPASATSPREVLVDSFDATAVDGSDVHRAISMRIKGAQHPPFEGENAAENEKMVELALDWFNANIRILYESVVTECRLTADFLSGTLDVLAIRSTKAVVVDWKTTYREDDHSAQLYSYAYLVFSNYSHIDEVEIFTAYLRGEGVLRKVLTRDWIMAWAEEVKHNILGHADLYRTGEHCLRCQRRIGCPAVREINRQTIAELEAGGEQLALTRERVASLRPRVKLVEKVIKAFDEFVRNDVIANGPIPTVEGKELRAVQMNFDHIDIVKAWPILQTEFTDAEMSEFVEVGKTAMLKAIAAKTAKGKGKAQDAFMSRLRSTGAVNTTQGIQVREVACH